MEGGADNSASDRCARASARAKFKPRPLMPKSSKFAYTRMLGQKRAAIEANLSKRRGISKLSLLS